MLKASLYDSPMAGTTKLQLDFVISDDAKSLLRDATAFLYSLKKKPAAPQIRPEGGWASSLSVFWKAWPYHTSRTHCREIKLVRGSGWVWADTPIIFCNHQLQSFGWQQASLERWRFDMSVTRQPQVTTTKSLHHRALILLCTKPRNT